MRSLASAALVATSLFSIATTAAFGQPAAVVTPDVLAFGKHLAQECTTCHRSDGRSTNIPPIVGLEPDFFITTMKFYKSGARDNPVMNSVAQALNDEQLVALAAYLATLKPPTKPSQARRK